MNTLLQRRNIILESDSDIIYQLHNYELDGTVATCINTGILLLSEQFAQEHPCFSIELDVSTNVTNSNKAHIIRCNRPDDPYYGFYIRVNGSTTYYGKFSNSVSNPNFTQDNQMSIAGMAKRKWIFNAGQNKFMAMYEDSFMYNGGYTVTSEFNSIPLLIGGNLNDITDESKGWKETWIGTINHLVIRDVVI